MIRAGELRYRDAPVGGALAVLYTNCVCVQDGKAFASETENFLTCTLLFRAPYISSFILKTWCHFKGCRFFEGKRQCTCFEHFAIYL